MDVLLDTNIYLRYFNLSRPSPAIQSLKNYLEVHRKQLLIPQIVDLELRRQYKEKVMKEMDKLERSYLIQHSLIKVPRKTRTVENKLLRYYQEFLDTTRHEIIPCGKLSIKPLITKSVNKIAPFDTRGRGFCDAVIWQTMVKQLRKHRQQKHGTAFITSNEKDFGQDEKLNQTLVDELTKTKLLDRVHYFNSLTGFLNQHAQPFEFISEDYLRKVIDELELVEGVKSRDDGDLIQILDFDHPSLEEEWSVVKIDRTAMILPAYHINSYYIVDSSKDSVEMAVESTINFDVDIQADREVIDYDICEGQALPVDISCQYNIAAGCTGTFLLSIDVKNHDAVEVESLFY